jgi:hypothetical protein
VAVAVLVYMVKEQVVPALRMALMDAHNQPGKAVPEDRAAVPVAKAAAAANLFGITGLLDLKQLHPTVLHTELQDNLDTQHHRLMAA